MQPEKRLYLVLVRHHGETMAEHNLQLPDRQTAVVMALRWFWGKFGGTLGKAIDMLTVGDPYGEVVYNEPAETFNCKANGNNYLDEVTRERIILASNGKLEQDTKEGAPNHPRRSLRRKRRRRNEFRSVRAPNIHESNSGVFYYRVVVTPQISKRGVITQKRKIQDIRLDATTLAAAIEEIRAKGLRSRNKVTRQMKKRSLKLVAHVAGTRPLGADDEKFFASVLKPKASPFPK